MVIRPSKKQDSCLQILQVFIRYCGLTMDTIRSYGSVPSILLYIKLLYTFNAQVWIHSVSLIYFQFILQFSEVISLNSGPQQESVFCSVKTIGACLICTSICKIIVTRDFLFLAYLQLSKSSVCLSGACFFPAIYITLEQKIRYSKVVLHYL